MDSSSTKNAIMLDYDVEWPFNMILTMKMTKKIK